MEQVSGSFKNLRFDTYVVEAETKGLYQSAAMVNVDGVQVGSTAHTLLLVLGAGCIIGALAANKDMISPVLGVFGVLLVIGYFVTRQSKVIVFAGELELAAVVGGASHKTAVAFAQNLQRAQLHALRSSIGETPEVYRRPADHIEGLDD